MEYDHLFMGTRDVAMTYDPAFIAAINHNERIRQDVEMVTAHQLSLERTGGEILTLAQPTL